MMLSAIIDETYVVAYDMLLPIRYEDITMASDIYDYGAFAATAAPATLLFRYLRRYAAASLRRHYYTPYTHYDISLLY